MRENAWVRAQGVDIGVSGGPLSLSLKDVLQGIQGPGDAIAHLRLRFSRASMAGLEAFQLQAFSASRSRSSATSLSAALSGLVVFDLLRSIACAQQDRLSCSQHPRGAGTIA